MGDGAAVLSRIRAVFEDEERAKRREAEAVLEEVRALQAKPWLHERSELDELNGQIVATAAELEAMDPHLAGRGMQWTKVVEEYLSVALAGADVKTTALTKHEADTQIRLCSTSTGRMYKVMVDEKNNGVAFVRHGGKGGKVAAAEERKLMCDVETQAFHGGLLLQRFHNDAKSEVDEMGLGPHLLTSGPRGLLRALLLLFCRAEVAEAADVSEGMGPAVTEFLGRQEEAYAQVSELPVKAEYVAAVDKCRAARLALLGALRVPLGPLSGEQRRDLVEAMNRLDEQSFVVPERKRRKQA